MSIRIGSVLGCLRSAACGALLAIASADEAVVDPTCYLPEQCLATLQLNDLMRSRARFAASPYAKLLDTGWGRKLVHDAGAALDKAAADGADLRAALASLSQVVAGVAMADGAHADIGVVATVIGDTAPVQAWCAKLLSVDARVGPGGAAQAWLGGPGQITRLGQRFVFQSAPADGGAVEEAKPRSAAKQSAFPSACLEGRIDLGKAAALVGKLVAAQGGAVAAKDVSSVSAFSMSIDPIGLREHWSLPFPAAQAAELKALDYPPADLALLRSLPATTLFAGVTRVDAATTRKQLDIGGAAAGGAAWASIDTELTDAGLPGIAELSSGIDGQILVYCEEGIPFPSATIAIGLTPELGGKVLKALGEKLTLTDGGDGVLAGFLGIVPLQACYRDGQLVVTSNPAGIAAFKDRKPGFADIPEIKAALAEIRPGAVAAGVSRSGASWGTFAQLAWLPLSQLGLDARYASLPQDLRAAGKYGFISYQRSDDGFTLDSGGLVGGALGVYSLGIGAAAGYFCYEMGMIPNLEKKAAPAAPAPVPKGGEPVF